MRAPGELADQRFGTVLRWARGVQPETLVVVCAEADPDRASDGGFPVLRLTGCLAGLPAYRLTDLAAAAGGRVVAAAHPCAHPDRLEHLRALARVTGHRVTVLDAAPAEPAPPGTLVELEHPPVGRRFLLRGQPGDDEHHDPDADDAARLVASLRALGVGEGDGAEASPAVTLAVAGCTACGVCVRSCPHDALHITVASGRATLAQLPDRCRGEAACAENCPEHAITLGDHHPWETALAGEPLVLDTLRVRACARCQTPIPLDRADGLCAPCSHRRREPFGWEVPEAVRSRLPEHQRRLLDERPR